MGKLKEIVLKYKNIIAVLLTIFVAIGINVTFDNDLNALKLNSSIYNIFFLYNIQEFSNKRQKIMDMFINTWIYICNMFSNWRYL